MRVLYVAPSLQNVSETFIRDLIVDLSKQVEALGVISNDLGARPPAELVAGANGNVWSVPFLSVDSLLDKLAVRLLRQRPIGADGRLSGVFSRQALSAISAVASQFNPDVAYVEFGTTLVRVADAFADLGIPMVVHVHGHDITAALSLPGYRIAIDRAFQLVDRVIVASRHMANLAVLAGANPDKVAVVRLGVDSNMGSASISGGHRKTENPSLVSVGRMVPKKCPLAVLEAFRLVLDRMPSAELHWIGDGPERPFFEQRARRYGILDKIYLYGAMPKPEALQVVQNKWVYVQHSVTYFDGDQEGFGLSIAEAALLGLPVVATMHNGIPEQVIDGGTGFLVKEFDYEGMAAKVCLLLESPLDRARMGAAGIERIADGFERVRRARQVAACLTSVIERT